MPMYNNYSNFIFNVKVLLMYTFKIYINKLFLEKIYQELRMLSNFFIIVLLISNKNVLKISCKCILKNTIN